MILDHLYFLTLVLSWEKTNLPQDSKINRKVMVDAALQNNSNLVSALYDFDYRIDVDFLAGNKFLILLVIIFSAYASQIICTVDAKIG